MIETTIVGPVYNKEVHVTQRGELVVGKLAFSNAYNTIANVINTGFNLVVPKAKKQFVITGILLFANKDVAVTDATVVLYEADSPTTTTVSSNILTTEMIKQSRADLLGLNLIINTGKWINIKTDDNTIYCTILGYYVEYIKPIGE